MVSQSLYEHCHWVLSDYFKVDFSVLSYWNANVHVDMNFDDHLLWCFFANGGVISKAMYLNKLGEHIRDNYAKVLWVKHVPTSKAFFCWRFLKSKIPIDDVFHRWGISLAFYCGLCKNCKESFSHLLYIALLLWLFEILLLPNFLFLSATAIISLYFGKPCVLELVLKSLTFGMLQLLLDFLLLVRIESLHNNVVMLISQVLVYIVQFIKEANFYQIGSMNYSVLDLHTLRKLGVLGLPWKAPKILYVLWKFLAPNWLKLEIDGKAKGCLGLANGGGVFKNCQGFICGYFMIPLGFLMAFEAELLTTIFGLGRAMRFSWDHILLECDYSFVVNLLPSHSKKVPWKFRAWWKACLHFIYFI